MKKKRAIKLKAYLWVRMKINIQFFRYLNITCLSLFHIMQWTLLQNLFISLFWSFRFDTFPTCGSLLWTYTSVFCLSCIYGRKIDGSPMNMSIFPIRAICVLCVLTAAQAKQTKHTHAHKIIKQIFHCLYFYCHIEPSRGDAKWIEFVYMEKCHAPSRMNFF